MNLNNSSKRIAVVGGGVIGLTTASKLVDQGYVVDVFSREAPSDTSSMAAGAYWWPHRAYPENRIAAWSKTTYREYLDLSRVSLTGVSLKSHLRFCFDPDESIYALNLVDDWQEIEGSLFGMPCSWAFRALLPVIDVPIFMPYLRTRLVSMGVAFHLQEIECPQQLFMDFDMVINCTGVQARKFVNDEQVFPIRGQTVRVSLPDGLTESTRIYRQDDSMTLVLPRSNDVVLGGTYQSGNWNRTPDSEDTEAILRRCAQAVPQIAGCKILGSSVGLRPGRKTVRLELETTAAGQPLIHNYGHGGSGYTVAWGCAEEVCSLVDAYFMR